jgi:hypothetical protein
MESHLASVRVRPTFHADLAPVVDDRHTGRGQQQHSGGPGPLRAQQSAVSGCIVAAQQA